VVWRKDSENVAVALFKEHLAGVTAGQMEAIAREA
jgi:hypothetical protein